MASKTKERWKWKYINDDEHSNQNHSVKNVCSCGAHLFPFFMFTIILVTLVTTLVMYYLLDRNPYELCWEIYGDPEECDHDTTWIVPTISYTGQSSPEWLIFAVGLSIGAICFACSIYFVHRRAWATAMYRNVDINRPGKLVTDPHVFCVPCCCCTERHNAQGEKRDQFCKICFCSPSFRPSLRLMLKVTEALGYISAFFLFWVGWARMKWSWEIHNFVAFVFFGAGIAYIPLYTFAQHQIKKKCPAKFHHPWRYIVKVTCVALLVIIGLTYVFTILDLWMTCGAKWSTSNARRIGFPVGEYLGAFFVGFYILTHVEDIRVDGWYLEEQQSGQDIPMNVVQGPHDNADFRSTFPAPKDDTVTTEPAPSSF